jgi:hypothetical protein
MLGSLLALEGCGSAQYKIPNVEPVVKQKPQDDLLENIEGNTPSSGSPSTDSTDTSSAPPAPSSGSDGSSGSADKPKK